MARAVQAGPLWRTLAESTLIIRDQLLAVIGDWDEAGRARISFLAELTSEPPPVHYVDWQGTQELAANLAEELLRTVGREWLESARFVSIPRGGLIVLGMLAYYLDITPNWNQEAETVVVVDDVVLTGTRFRSTLRELSASDVVFATLAAPEPLLRAIENEPEIRVCVSAHHLHDHAPQQQGNELEAWKERWRTYDPDLYWIGQPTHIAFPWNEPDISFWNPVTEAVEAGWRLLPPELCIKNRPTPEAPDLRTITKWPGTLQPAPGVLYAPLGGGVGVVDIATGEAVKLEDTAASIWRALELAGTRDQVLEELAQEYDVEHTDLTAHVEEFIRRMTELGYLVV